MNGQYDHKNAMYIFPNGAGIPVATMGSMDTLEHLMHPALLQAGIRAAVCNQNIELNWMTCMVVKDNKPAPPNPICAECINTVEQLV